MKLVCKVSLAFKRLKVDAKVSFGANVINSLNASPDKSLAKINKLADDPNLPLPVAQLTEINNDLARSVSDSLTGNHTAKASVKNNIIAWNYAFGLTANYISSLAQGDAIIILQAGFVPTKTERIPRQKPAVPKNFRATINGSKGAVIAGSRNKVPDALVYLFSALPDEAAISYVDNTIIFTVGGHNIYLTVSTSKKTEIYNLPSGVPVNMSMVAINCAGNSPAAASHRVIPQ